jgi:hypothetical protein
VSRAAFHHLDFRVTSRLLVVAVALNAEPRVYPMSWKGVSTSNHPTALASQVAWITGESQISRPKKITYKCNRMCEGKLKKGIKKESVL